MVPFQQLVNQWNPNYQLPSEQGQMQSQLWEFPELQQKK